tara:strand:+ start:90 stop:317 length:228 start_codon:yes stop_codon:yes gene_type:complete
MGFKIEKDKPIKESHYRTAFTQALNNLQVGDAITGLTKKQAYGFRSNFYTLNFRDRKFKLWKDAETKMHCIQRVS